MNTNYNNPNYLPPNTPNDGITKPPTPINKPIMPENTNKQLPNVPWRGEKLPTKRLLDDLGKLDFGI